MRMISSRLVVVVKGQAMRLAICLWLALLGLPGLVLNEFRVEAWAAQDLAQLSLEELMMVEVSTVGKRSQTLSETPAAIYVLTQEEIRRSGATSIPEALRRVPGLNVAQLNSNQWAISARGFNGLFANKVLVLIDGRNVYSPLFAGVNWDVQDMLLEDVERIEVIRGPGATLWGANATNGVINIITKRAEDTPRRAPHRRFRVGGKRLWGRAVWRANRPGGFLSLLRKVFQPGRLNPPGWQERSRRLGLFARGVPHGLVRARRQFADDARRHLSRRHWRDPELCCHFPSFSIHRR